jgi:hypothetical protein
MKAQYGSVVKASVTSGYENGRCRLFPGPFLCGCGEAMGYFNWMKKPVALVPIHYLVKEMR